ncbi:hypothetical protein HHI36_006248 [Cryptolaemus montrouzieri]|uniref:Uncharacterized protein n=1 Tax=Cryptolaemus montrouzieri TaxID=559131 RepID=A0ABD2NXM6_9CUCU
MLLATGAYFIITPMALRIFGLRTQPTSADEGVLQPQQLDSIERQQQQKSGGADLGSIENPTNNSSTSTNWREPSKKRNRNTRLRLGTAKTDENQKQVGFAGVEKKAWCFVSRIKPHVTEETITNFENLTKDLKELFFKGKVNDLRSFLVKVPFEKKDHLYNTQVWSENV